MFDLSLLKGTEGLLSFEENREEEENYRQFLKQAFEKALKGFLQMKEQEGSVLQNDMLNRLKKNASRDADLSRTKPLLQRSAIGKN